MLPDETLVVVEQLLVGSVQPVAERSGSSVGNQWKPSCAARWPPGSGPRRRAGAAVLDGWLPNPPTGRGNRTAGRGVHVGPVRQRLANHAALCAGEETLQLGAEALLGGPEQPVGRLERLAQGDRPPDALCGGSPAQDGRARSRRARCRAQTDAIAIARACVGVEAIHDHDGVDATLGQLAPAQVVDAHVVPGKAVSGGMSDTAAGARCQGGSWWSTAGRPRSTSARTSAAGRFSGRAGGSRRAPGRRR